MVLGINSGVTNPISMLNATKAFSVAQTPLRETLQIDDRTSNGIDLKDTQDLLVNKNISEIKEFAKCVGTNDLTVDDIKYGLKYGRSVIADYTL